MENEKLTVLVVEPEKRPYVKEISSGLESLHEAVGGYIEAVYPFEDPVGIICDEEGKLKGKPFNRALRDDEGNIYDILAGTFLVVGLSEEDFTSLTPEQISKFSDYYKSPEMFTRINGQLIVIPLEEFEDDMENTSLEEMLHDAENKQGASTSKPSIGKEARDV